MTVTGLSSRTPKVKTVPLFGDSFVRGSANKRYVEFSSDFSDEDFDSSSDHRHKRANSDPPEETNNPLNALAQTPVFSSFRVKADPKAHTRQPKERHTLLRFSFLVDDLFKAKRKKNLPSLAALDNNRVPPILPVANYSAQTSQINARNASAAFATVATHGIQPRKLKPVPRMAKRTIPAAMNPAVAQSFYKKPPMKKAKRMIIDEDELELLSKKSPSPPVAIFEGEELPVRKSSKSLSMPGTYHSFGSTSHVTSATTSSPFAVDEDRTQEDPMSVDSRSINRFSVPEDSDESDGSEDPDIIEKHIINPNTSFRDNVVIRGTQFNYTAPSSLSCTHASVEDSIRMKLEASKLDAFDVSESIYHSLAHRVERMVSAELDAMEGKLRQGQSPPSIQACAVKLRDWLVESRKKRVGTGECERFVEHELQWAEWFVVASGCGVLHLKVGGCRCRPEWESGPVVRFDEEGNVIEEEDEEDEE